MHSVAQSELFEMVCLILPSPNLTIFFSILQFFMNIIDCSFHENLVFHLASYNLSQDGPFLERKVAFSSSECMGCILCQNTPHKSELINSLFHFTSSTFAALSQERELTVRNVPRDPSRGSHTVPFGRVLYIDRADFREVCTWSSTATTSLKQVHTYLTAGSR